MPRYSSIQVSPAMRRRLARYKAPGMSYEDVLEMLLVAIPPDEVKARAQRAQEAASRERAAVGRRDPPIAAEEARAIDAARIAALSPGERMEESYRLFALLRGIA